MKRFLIITLSCLFLIGIATVAQAQATRTWVSGVGDDVNPCSRTAPCKTYAGAISKTAAGGIISTLDPGGFGGVTITKGITIDGTAQIAGVLVSGTNAIVVNATNTDVVTLRNLEIHGIGTGLNAVQALAFGELNIEECRIQNFATDGVRIAPTAAQTHKVVVRNCDIRNNLRGIEVVPGASALVRLMVDQSNLSGHQSGSGVDVVSNGDVSVLNSSLTHNGTGLQVQAGSGNASIQSSVVAYNTTGIFGGGEVRLNNNTVTGNGTGVSGTTRCFQSNAVIGNTAGNTCTFTVIGQ